MRIEIVAIGEEILKGYTVNTNASFLSRELRKRGYKVARHTVLPDIPEIMEEGIREALQRSDVVITTGGLGPTSDDLTKAVLLKIFSEKEVILKNSVGTASGLAFSEKGKSLFALPGIPREMEEMFRSEAFPILAKEYPLKERIYIEELYLAILSENPVDRFIASLQLKNIEVGIYPSIGVLHLTFAGKEREKLISISEKVKEEFNEHYFKSESGLLEEAVHNIFISQKKTLALAESCTGGNVAKRLTALPGSSEYFLGSIVSYSNELKQNLLHVALDDNDAFSLEAVSQMVQGVFENTSADFALAVSGIAGPTGGTEGKPVGTVYVALAERNGPVISGRIHAKGRTRVGIIEYTTNFCLFSLFKYLQSRTPPMFS